MFKKLFFIFLSLLMISPSYALNLSGVRLAGVRTSTPPNISYFTVRDNAETKDNDVEYFNTLMGVSSTETTDIEQHYFVMPVDGVFKRFRVKWDKTLTGGMAVEYYLVINGVSTHLATCDSTGSTKFNNDISIQISAGDLVAYKVILRNSPTLTHYWASIEFENPDYMVIAGNNKTALNVDTARYFMLQSTFNGLSGTGADGDIFWPTSGTLKSLYVNFSSPPGTGKSRTVTVRRESSVSDGSVTISNLNTTGTINLNRSKVQGNQTRLEITGSGTAASAYVRWAAIWQPSIRGEYPIFFREFDALDMSQRNWNYLLGCKTQWTVVGDPFPTGTGERRVPLRGGFVVKKALLKVQTAPGSGKSLQLSYMTDDSTTKGDILVTLSDTNTIAYDNVGKFETVEGEEYALSILPVNTPTASTRVYSSFVLAK